MGEKNTPTRLIQAGDHYLDQHGHTDEAYRHVLDVYQKFEWMAERLITGAMEELEIPDNVIFLPRRGE